MNRPNTQEELSKSIRSMAQEELKNLQKARKLADKSGQAIEDDPNYREPLSMDVTREVNIMLSWGGPSDGFKLKFDNDANMIGGVYWYADWGTYAEDQLDDDEAELVYSIYLGGDSSIAF